MTLRPAVAALALLSVLAASPLASAAPSPATDIPGGHYVMDKRHSSLIARVNHMGVSLFTLRFDTLDASFDYDPGRPEGVRLSATVDPTSLDVNADYGKDFAEEFLTVSKFPTASFVATGAMRGATPGQGTLTGNLTLMGVTKPVTFNVTLIGSGHEPLPLPLGQHAVGLEATTTIKRSDFGSTYLNNLVGDDVQITIEAEFDKK
jgi:polyisoprenoid-binding protein YceI